MEVLNEAGVLIFQETPVGPWIWLLLLLPGIFVAGALHQLLRPDPFESRDAQDSAAPAHRPYDPNSRGFALGVLLLAGVFLPLPWIARESSNGLRFEFDESAALVRVRDARSPDVYASPFAAFRGLILAHETQSNNDGDGGATTTYELILARTTGPSYALFRSEDRERVLELANRLSHMLRVTTVTDFASALAFAREAPNTAARMPTPFECDGSDAPAGSDTRAGQGAGSASEALSGFRDLRKRYVAGVRSDSCVLEYPKKVPPLVWPALLAALAALYWLVYLLRPRGMSWRMGAGFVLATGLLAARCWLVLRNYNATGVVSFEAAAGAGRSSEAANTGGAELRVWTEAALIPGRLGEGSLDLRDVRFVQASISAREDSFYIHDRNPLAFRNLADAFHTARNLRTLELELAAVPVVDRLRLADILATGLAW